MNTFTALVVEDSESSRILYGRLLTSLGYSTMFAANCDQARDCLDRSTPNVAILDMGLPDGSGLSLVKYLNETERFASTVIIVITGRGEYQQSIDQYNVDYSLYKPVSMMMLDTLLQRIAVASF